MDIDKIILRAINDKASLEEYEMLEAWKKESERNLEYLNTLMETPDNGHTPYQQFDNKKAWDKISQNIDAGPSPYKWVGVLIIVAMILGLAYFFYQQQNNRLPKVHETRSQMAQVILKDNSEVNLNTHSKLLVLSDFAESRDVRLEGEAFFDIAKDASRPFQIMLDGEDYVKVVGTSFNLVNEEDNFDLTVYSGVVELHTLDRVLELRKDDRISKVNGSYVKYLNNDLNLTSWNTRQLVFENSTLKDVFTDLGDHYNVTFSLDDKSDSSNCTLRTKFTDQTIEEVMTELKALFEFNYKIKGSSIQISDLKCN